MRLPKTKKRESGMIGPDLEFGDPPPDDAPNRPLGRPTAAKHAVLGLQSMPVSDEGPRESLAGAGVRHG